MFAMLAKVESRSPFLYADMSFYSDNEPETPSVEDVFFSLRSHLRPHD